MAHIYMTFDFGADEEKAQQARHKLDVWKQAFRLDKRLLYKFERPAQEGDGTPQAEAAPARVEKPATGGKGGKAGGTKAKAKTEEKPAAASVPTGPVKLHLRLAFSGHEKMTEERWLKRPIPKLRASLRPSMDNIEAKLDCWRPDFPTGGWRRLAKERNRFRYNWYRGSP